MNSLLTEEMHTRLLFFQAKKMESVENSQEKSQPGGVSRYYKVGNYLAAF
jgi:hypothetical protein